MKILYVKLSYGAQLIFPVDMAPQIIAALSQAQFVDDHYIGGNIGYEYVLQKNKEIDFSFVDDSKIVDKKTPDPIAQAPAQAAATITPTVIPAEPISIEINPGDIMNQALRHSLGADPDPIPMDEEIPF